MRYRTCTTLDGAPEGSQPVKRKLETLAARLQASSCSRTINTALVERHNGTDRTYNARKRRKTCEFAKELAVHIAVR